MAVLWPRLAAEDGLKDGGGMLERHRGVRGEVERHREGATDADSGELSPTCTYAKVSSRLRSWILFGRRCVGYGRRLPSDLVWTRRRIPVPAFVSGGVGFDSQRVHTLTTLPLQ